MKENVIISLADSNYFELVNELVDSIKSFDQSKEIAICIMDAGLQKDQIEILEKKVDQIKKAEWDIEVSDSKIKGKICQSDFIYQGNLSEFNILEF